MRRRLAWTTVLAACVGLAGCASAPDQARPAALAGQPAPATGQPTEPSASMQYLYGSAEAAALTRQSWHALVGYVTQQVKARPRDSVVLASGASLSAPHYVPCGDKPFAAIFDVDETVLLNYGFEGWQAAGGQYRQDVWAQWERSGADDVAPTPGARAALRQLRALGVTVIFSSNRSAANAAYTAQALDHAGLGPAKHGETLFLDGDDATGGHKDARRALIAGRYCVLAMGGDQLGDISDLFNAIPDVRARRAATATPAIADNWGAGWFVFPNPVYGAAVRGGLDAIFPTDKRWAPPAKEKN